MKYIKLFLALVICQMAGILGAIFTTPAINGWYTSLNKPGFNPPNWIFGPVWTLLYLMMGVSLYLVWKTKPSKGRKLAMTMFGVQLGFNSLWSIIFFGLKRPDLALVEITVLWIFILLTILRFWKVSKLATWLLVPYLLWVSFASVLNFSIMRLN